MLDQLAADALDLWKVSIPFDDRFEQNVNALDLKTEGRLLPLTKLSSLFSKESTGEFLDIVIKVPDGKLELFSAFQVLSNLSSLRVLIKFCQTYYGDAHRMVANAGYAATAVLLRKAAGRGDDGHHGTVPSNLLDDVKAAIGILHIVFGDLRRHQQDR